MIEGERFRVTDSGFRVDGLRVHGLQLRAFLLGFRVYGYGTGVYS